MAGMSGQSRRAWRWLLTCLVTAALAGAVPSAASASTPSPSGQRPELVGSVLAPELGTAALAPSAKNVAAHHATHQARWFDAAASSLVSTIATVRAVSGPVAGDSPPRVAAARAATSRAPPVEGSA